MGTRGTATTIMFSIWSSISSNSSIDLFGAPQILAFCASMSLNLFWGEDWRFAHFSFLCFLRCSHWHLLFGFLSGWSHWIQWRTCGATIRQGASIQARRSLADGDVGRNCSEYADGSEATSFHHFYSFLGINPAFGVKRRVSEFWLIAIHQIGRWLPRFISVDPSPGSRMISTDHVPWSMNQGHFTIAWGFYQFPNGIWLLYDYCSHSDFEYHTEPPFLGSLESSRLLPSMCFWSLKYVLSSLGCTPGCSVPMSMLKKSWDVFNSIHKNVACFLETNIDYVIVFTIYLPSGNVIAIYCYHPQPSIVIYNIPLLYHIYPTVSIIT